MSSVAILSFLLWRFGHAEWYANHSFHVGAIASGKVFVVVASMSSLRASVF